VPALIAVIEPPRLSHGTEHRNRIEADQNSGQGGKIRFAPDSPLEEGGFAVCAGHTVDAVVKKHDPEPCEHADELAAALKLDMTNYWQATASGYFARVSKQQTLAAVAEGAGKEAAENLAKLKKDELGKEAEKRLNGTGWLPAILRAA
jgi:hypothetical protein